MIGKKKKKKETANVQDITHRIGQQLKRLLTN